MMICYILFTNLIYCVLNNFKIGITLKISSLKVAGIF